MPQTQAIGPWDGGLNLSSNRDLSPFLKNNELGAALNVQLTPEGFVESRPGFKTLDVTFNTGNPIIDILGTMYVSNEYVTVVQVKTTDTQIYYVRGDKTAVLKANFPLSESFSSILALRNYEDTLTNTSPRGIFIFSSVAENKCYRLEEVPNLTSLAVPVLMSSTLKIPKSHFSFSVKERVWLIDAVASKIYWSAVFDNSLFFDQAELSETPPALSARALETGDVALEPSVDASDNITSVEFSNNSFYLFKKASSFLFSYQADPEADGFLRKFNESLGAFDSTLFKNTVVVINNRGVYAVEGTEFIDLQTKLNLRFETSLDNRSSGIGFISTLNTDLIIGYKSEGEDPYHYIMNGSNRGWTQWDFNYAIETDPKIATPGSNGYFTQDSVGTGIILFNTFEKDRLIYTDWKPTYDITDYTLDSNIVRDSEAGSVIRYAPNINIKSRTMLGDSMLDYKKLLRTYVRLYISDAPNTLTGATWDFSINYNDYYFTETNPKYLLFPRYPDPNSNQAKGPWNNGMPPQPIALVPINEENVETVLYRRTYQIPIHQHRVKEYTFELTRGYNKFVDAKLLNPTADRPIENGYYLLLSGFWADYNEKARI